MSAILYFFFYRVKTPTPGPTPAGVAILWFYRHLRRPRNAVAGTWATLC